MNLTCPVCENTLSKIILSDIVVDVCQGGCAGIWLDKNEVKKFDEKHEKDGEILTKLKKNPTIQVDQTKDRFCPVCSQKMTKHFFSINQQVEVDECEKCGGIWLDSGELAAIREEFETEEDRDKAAKLYFQEYTRKLFNEADKENAKNADFIDKFMNFIGNKLGLY